MIVYNKNYAEAGEDFFLKAMLSGLRWFSQSAICEIFGCCRFFFFSNRPTRIVILCLPLFKEELSYWPHQCIHEICRQDQHTVLLLCFLLYAVLMPEFRSLLLFATNHLLKSSH